LKEVPGLIINRMQMGLIREVWSLWQEGVASAEDLDLAAKGSFGFRLAAIGPLETCDLGGLDTWRRVAQQLFKVISDTHEPPEKLNKMVEAGELGLKSGKGFFSYNVGYFDKGQDEKVKIRDKKFIQLLKLLYS
jgi:3-hydroxybutyryl-CoA dehydrogenase